MAGYQLSTLFETFQRVSTILMKENKTFRLFSAAERVVANPGIVKERSHRTLEKYVDRTFDFDL